MHVINIVQSKDKMDGKYRYIVTVQHQLLCFKWIKDYYTGTTFSYWPGFYRWHKWGSEREVGTTMRQFLNAAIRHEENL